MRLFHYLLASIPEQISCTLSHSFNIQTFKKKHFDMFLSHIASVIKTCSLGAPVISHVAHVEKLSGV